MINLKKLKQARVECGFKSRENLAMIMGISPHTYKSIERGVFNSKHPIEFLEVYCGALNTSGSNYQPFDFLDDSDSIYITIEQGLLKKWNERGVKITE